MTEPRRRVIRPTPVQRRSNQREKLCLRLEKERSALRRWQTKLRRAFKAVEKCQSQVARLEHQLHREQE